MTTHSTTGRNTMPDLHIDGKTPDEAYAKLVDNCPPDQIAHRHEYALNHLVKRAQEIGYQDGIAAGQPKQLPTTLGSVISTQDMGYLVLDREGAWGNSDYAASPDDITRNAWVLVHDNGQEQNT